MTPQEYDLLMDGVADGVKEYVAPLVAQIHALKAELADLQSRPVVAGKDGRDGKDADPIPAETIDLAIKTQVAEYLAAYPPAAGPAGADGKDGRDGIDAVGAVGPMGPAGEKGLDGAPGTAGTDGRAGADGRDGESWSVSGLVDAISHNDHELRDVLLGMFDDAMWSRAKELVKSLPVPADGAPGAPGERGADGADGKDGVGLTGAVISNDGDLVLTLSDGSLKEVGRVVGRDGSNGIKGDRGADGINGKDGLDGFGFDDLEFTHDGERGFALRYVKGERVKEFPFAVPVMLFKGVFKEGTTYAQSDCVQWGGNMFAAKCATSMKPSETGGDWILVVRRGKPGGNGPQGPPGETGPRGKDWGAR